MAQIPVFLFLKADGNDVEAESSIQSMADIDTSKAIECHSYEEGVAVGFDRRSSWAQSDRTYEPITITKWVDKSSPVLAQALTRSQQCSGEFKFFRPIADGGGWEHWFTVKVEDARVCRLKRRISEGTEDAPVKEEVSLVFSRITWTHIPGSKEFADSWRERTGS
jgi:type VI secretion system secreted protein Hcp